MAWELTGNFDATAASFLGSTNAQPLIIRTGPTPTAQPPERLRITPDGKIGIGTATPQARLSIAGAGAIINNVAVGTDGVNLDYPNERETIGLANPGPGGVLRLQSPNGLTFHTGAPGTTPEANERARITADGRVGVGTPTPGAAYKLDVAGALNATELYKNGTPLISSQWAGVPGGISYAAGNVGVGTGNPQAGAHISSGEPQLRVDGPGNRTLVQLAKSGSPQWDFGVGTGVAGNNDLWFGDFISYRMVLQKGTGNVGIGTGDPRRRLQIGGDIAGLGIEPSDASPNAGYVRFGDNTGWKLHFGRSRESSSGPTLNTGTSGVLMTIQDNGNVGIGTSGPGARLSVAGGGATINGVTLGGDAPGAIDYPYEYESVGVTQTSFNLRLQSPNWIFFHTGDALSQRWGLSEAGDWVKSSSRDLKEDILDLTAPEAVAALAGLKPVTYTWTDDRERKPRLGFIAEDTPEIAATPDGTAIIPFNILTVLTRAVQEQQRVIGSICRQLGLDDA